MRKYIKWTPEKVAEIAERYKKETAIEIARDLGIKTLTLRAHMHKHGIKNTKKLMGWSKESLDLIKSEYATCERPQALAIRIGIPLPKMQIRIEKTKATKANFSDYQKAMYSYRHKLIWTPERLEKMKEKLRARYAEKKQK